MIYDGRGRNYIFGKTFMDSHEVAKWLEIDEFVAGIDDLRNSSQDINDATVLCLMNRIIEKHSDDSDETFPLDWAFESVDKFRKKIPKAYFDKDWLKETYPDAWDSIVSVVNNGAIIIPFQMHKYVCFLKYFTERAEMYDLAITADSFNTEQKSAVIIIRLSHLFLGKIDDVSSLMKHMSRCSGIELNCVDGKAEIKMTIPNVLMSAEEFDKVQSKRAWTLQWNQNYISANQKSPFTDINQNEITNAAKESDQNLQKKLEKVIIKEDEIQHYLQEVLPLTGQEISYWRKSKMFENGVRDALTEFGQINGRQVLDIMSKIIRLYIGTEKVDAAKKGVLVSIANKLRSGI